MQHRKHLPDSSEPQCIRRRPFLASLGLSGLAGCLGGSNGTPSESSTDTVAKTTDTQDDPVPEVVLRSSLRHVVNDDGTGFEVPDGDQFAFVQAPAFDDPPPLDAFSLEIGARSFDPESFRLPAGSTTPGIDGVYTDQRRAGHVPFDVPTLEAETGALVVDGTRHPLPSDALPDFATAPDLVLESVSVPDTAPPNDEVELAVEASNRGDAEGIFLAGFRRGGLPETIDIPLAPGERNSASVYYDTRDGGGSIYFQFTAPDVDRSYEVAVESAE